jgi:hypothetical protein
MTHDVERVLADIDADHGDRRVEFLRHGVLLVLSAPCQLLVLAGPEHGRTIPLAIIGFCWRSPAKADVHSVVEPLICIKPVLVNAVAELRSIPVSFAYCQEIDMEQILINLVAGALGGVGAGKSSPTFDLGTAGNIISGLVGGGLLGQIATLLLPSVLAAAQSGNFSVSGIVSQAVAGGAGGAILTAIIGAIKNRAAA